MKLIITGATGFIGSVTLNKALEHPAVTKVVAYSRRPLKQHHPKLENVIQEDLNLPEDSAACIWCAGAKLGASLTQGKMLEAAAIEAAQKHGRFVYLSGMLAVKDQEASLWFGGDARKLKGETETKLGNHEDAYIARPSMVTKDWSIPMTIRVNDLAVVLVDFAINGNAKKIWENGEMVAHARMLKK